MREKEQYIWDHSFFNRLISNIKTKTNNNSNLRQCNQWVSEIILRFLYNKFHSFLFNNEKTVMFTVQSRVFTACLPINSKRSLVATMYYTLVKDNAYKLV